MSESIDTANENVEETIVANAATEIFEDTDDQDEQSLSSKLYKDFAGIDTESFIITTLKNNPKDRTLLLTVEKVLQDFIQNEEQTSYQFQAMNSYERMIVHRVAAFFGLDHNVDKIGQSIIVTKTANARIPNLSFQTVIPADEINNGASTISNDSNSRRPTTRNNKSSNPQIAHWNKTPVERSNYYTENREKYSNKLYRKQQQQRFYSQQTNMQSTSLFSNSRNQPMYSSLSTSYYPPQTMEYDYKQPSTNSSMYNYVPMISPNAYQHGSNLPVPILLHQQSTGQIQYVFPTQQPLSSDGQYMPVYRSDGMTPAMENNFYSPSPYVQLYPTHPYPPRQHSAPSFLIPPTHPSAAVQYATNQLAALSLQSPYNSDTRAIPSTNSIKSFQSNRPSRPRNPSATDKQLPAIENESRSSDQT